MTERKLRLGIVSAAHLHARNLIPQALACADATVVGLAETDAELRQHYASEHPGLAVYESADELYDRGRPEAIITCADNRAAADVVVDAAQRGVHVMKEKPMAADLALAERMAAAAARAGVRLMINWPTNWQPAIHHAKRLVEEGAIGQVWQVHNRSGHGGPPLDHAARGPIARVGWGWLIDRERNGGGAFVDFCSYGAVLSRWFMGQPSRVVALGGRYSKDFFTVEDNAILVLGYRKGHSVCEGTWTQPSTPVPSPLTIYGTEGTIAVTGSAEITIGTRNPSDMWKANGPTVLQSPDLPAHYASGPAYFVHQILTEQPFEGIVSASIARDAQEILQAGLTSMAEGREIGLPLKPFLTG
jgi:predicted dehydrogenase